MYATLFLFGSLQFRFSCCGQHSQARDLTETHSMRRLEELDAIRGLLLVWITLTHLPTVISAYVNQPFGFVSAAEGFIFLSALFTGRIYFRLAQRNGYRAMQQNLVRRTLRLYLYHAFLLSFAFLVAVPIAASGTRPGLHNLLDFYFDAGARRAIVDSALLVHRPPFARHSADVRYLSWTHASGIEAE
jgi:hypothetical protein